MGDAYPAVSGGYAERGRGQDRNGAARGGFEELAGSTACYFGHACHAGKSGAIRSGIGGKSGRNAESGGIGEWNRTS